MKNIMKVFLLKNLCFSQLFIFREFKTQIFRVPHTHGLGVCVELRFSTENF